MSLPERIVIVGPMGAGKSTIGRLLARELGYGFVDSDRLIEQRCGADIPWIFDVEGESGFRDREGSILEELSREQAIVMATGGGAIMRENNHPYLKHNARVIYLCTSVEQQYDRTRRDRNRPLLQKENPKRILQDLFELRDPIYRALADIVMMTDRKSPRLVVRQLVQRLHQHSPQENENSQREGHGHV
jgi:shikimate kinase